MKRFIVAIALAVLPFTAQAQYLVDGTDPSASSTVVQNGGYATNFYQTFIARGTALSSLSVWFYGGTYPTTAAEDQYARLFLFSGEGGLGPQLGQIYLDQSIQGRFDWIFADPLQMVLGATYTFSFFVNNCGRVVNGGCYAFGKLPGTEYREPAIEITTTDAYADGRFIQQYSESTPTNRDIRFEVAYIAEPTNGTLVGTGLVLFAAAARRRRRSARV